MGGPTSRLLCTECARQWTDQCTFSAYLVVVVLVAFAVITLLWRILL
jgi:hypothetical protein